MTPRAMWAPLCGLLCCVSALGQERRLRLDPYRFTALPRSGVRIHSPGPLHQVEDTPGSVRFKVDAWPSSPYFLLIHGCPPETRILLGNQAPARDDVQRHGDQTVILRLTGKPMVTLSKP